MLIPRAVNLFNEEVTVKASFSWSSPDTLYNDSFPSVCLLLGTSGRMSDVVHNPRLFQMNCRLNQNISEVLCFHCEHLNFANKHIMYLGIRCHNYISIQKERQRHMHRFMLNLDILPNHFITYQMNKYFWVSDTCLVLQESLRLKIRI